MSERDIEKYTNDSYSRAKVVDTKSGKRKNLQNLLERKQTREALQFERNQLLSIFDGIDEIVYVTDLETNEILYMNKFAREAAGENPLGKAHSKKAQSVKNPAQFGMKPGTLKGRDKHYRWEYHNPVLDRDYLITDRIIKWPDGRDVRFEFALDITERKKVEKELHKEQHKQREYFEKLPIPAYNISFDGTIEDCNNIAVKTLGYDSRDELIGKPLITTIYAPSSQKKAQQLLGKWKEQGELRNEELQIITKDGEILDVLLNIDTIFDHNGTALYSLSTQFDITSRKQMEKTLATRLRYEGSLAACSRALLTQTDLEKSILEVLKEMLKASGAGRVYIFENFHDKNDGLCTRQTHEVYAAGVKPEINNPILQHVAYKDGFERWKVKLSQGEKVVGLVKDFPISERKVLEPQQIVSILVLPISVAGQWYGFIGFDDTKQERQWNKDDIRLLQTAAEMIAIYLENRWTEEMLRESEERFRTIADFTYDFEYWVSPDGDYIYVSPSCKRVTGYTEENFLSDSGLMEKIVHPEDRQAISKHLREGLDSGEVFKADFRIMTRDGQQRWISHVCQPVYASDGHWLGRRASNRDITGRKADEKRLLAYQKQLKSLTSELLLTEEHEKRRLAVGLHDHIGQKLAMAKLTLQSLMKSETGSTLWAPLDEVRSELDQIIEDIHSFTFELSNPVLYELGLEAAVEQWLIEHVQNKHRLKCTFTACEQSLEMDNKVSIVLFQAVRELLVNIVKHAQAKTVQVHIRKDGNRIQVFVKDDGVGFKFSKDRLPLPAQKTDGFGLFSIRERLEYLGGNIEIESAPGCGSCVQLNAPLHGCETEGDKYENPDSR